MGRRRTLKSRSEATTEQIKWVVLRVPWKLCNSLKHQTDASTHREVTRVDKV